MSLKRGRKGASGKVKSLGGRTELRTDKRKYGRDVNSKGRMALFHRDVLALILEP